MIRKPKYKYLKANIYIQTKLTIFMPMWESINSCSYNTVNQSRVNIISEKFTWLSILSIYWLYQSRNRLGIFQIIRNLFSDVLAVEMFPV